MKNEVQKIYIVGAHSRGQTLARYLQYLYPEICIEAYLYNNNEKNPKRIEDIAVIHLESYTEWHIDYPVYIGTKKIYHEQIIKHLKMIGFITIIPVTMELDMLLRNRYLEKYYSSIGRSFIKIDRIQCKERFDKKLEDTSILVFVAKSVFDKPLQNEYILEPFEREIQVGAELTSKRLFTGILTDNIGENISGKNQQFCELTALYWIWKHAKEDILGLVHYRRHFIMPYDWAERMLINNLDVILPVPLYVAPNIEENFKIRHDPSDWDYMMQYLKSNDFKLYREAKKFFKTNLYSPCNMFIMRKEVLDDLCTWLFPILFQVAEHGGQKEDNYLNRYPGFISERLITFFFERNRKKYKIVYSDKNFLI